jgi:hypothetical protein
MHIPVDAPLWARTTLTRPAAPTGGNAAIR